MTGTGRPYNTLSAQDTGASHESCPQSDSTEQPGTGWGRRNLRGRVKRGVENAAPDYATGGRCGAAAPARGPSVSLQEGTRQDGVLPRSRWRRTPSLVQASPEGTPGTDGTEQRQCGPGWGDKAPSPFRTHPVGTGDRLRLREQFGNAPDRQGNGVMRPRVCTVALTITGRSPSPRRPHTYALLPRTLFPSASSQESGAKAQMGRPVPLVPQAVLCPR